MDNFTHKQTLIVCMYPEKREDRTNAYRRSLYRRSQDNEGKCRK
jgi:hypothetical protein